MISQWADYCAVVAAESGHNAMFVYKRLSFARGLHFLNRYARSKGIRLNHAGSDITLQTII
jgi:hypothetical protein